MDNAEADVEENSEVGKHVVTLNGRDTDVTPHDIEFFINDGKQLKIMNG